MDYLDRIEELVIQAAMIGSYTTTIEVNHDTFRAIEKEALEGENELCKIIYHNKEPTNSPLGISLDFTGWKIYVKCRSIGLAPTTGS